MAAPGPARPGRKVNYLLIGAGVAAALVLIAATALFLWLQPLWAGKEQPDAPVTEITIPRGASLQTAANILQSAGVVEQPKLFYRLSRVLGENRPIHYGVYAIPKGQGWGEILARLQRGDVLRIRVTIPEGMPSILVAERLMATERLTGDIETPEEGTVLPATYEADVNENRADLIARMQRQMTSTLDDLWAKRSPNTVVKTREEAVILASIVEKESGKASERRRIAGLYSNRLKVGMKLDADPTVIYPVTKGKPLGRRILRSELAADNGYNTYLRSGLPAGPITNPGRESIAAVLNPETHGYYYMVADGTGGHVFAKDYAAHLANVARWRQLRREQGF